MSCWDCVSIVYANKSTVPIIPAISCAALFFAATPYRRVFFCVLRLCLKEEAVAIRIRGAAVTHSSCYTNKTPYILATLLCTPHPLMLEVKIYFEFNTLSPFATTFQAPMYFFNVKSIYTKIQLIIHELCIPEGEKTALPHENPSH